MSENKQNVRLRYKNYKSINISSLRKNQTEHSSEIISNKNWITGTLSKGLCQGAYGLSYLLAWTISSICRGVKTHEMV